MSPADGACAPQAAAPAPGAVRDPDRPLSGGVVQPWTRAWYLVRIYHRDVLNPQPTTFRHFGPVDARFDHHEPPPQAQERSVLYMGDSLAGAVCESVARLVGSDTEEPGTVSICPEWFVALLRPIEAVELQDLKS